MVPLLHFADEKSHITNPNLRQKVKLSVKNAILIYMLKHYFFCKTPFLKIALKPFS